MEHSSSQRTIATAMLIMGFFIELLGIGFLVFRGATSSAVAVMVSGLLMVMLGIVFMSSTRR